MVKSKEEVIAQFNKDVNMTVEELEAWLEDPKSEKAGTGVGIDSGHKIVEILRKNPDKDPKKYDDDDLEHMRKVVGYTGRHLAQETHLKRTKTREELEDTKSTISLKNWGHDPTKGLDNAKADASAKADDAAEADANGVADPTQAESDEAQSVQRGSEKNGKQEQAEGKKRKLDEDEPAQTDAAEPEVQANSANGEADGEGEGDGDVDEIDDEANGEEGRPRKKSRVDGDD